jgi:hypothetical protein
MLVLLDSLDISVFRLFDDCFFTDSGKTFSVVSVLLLTVLAVFVVGRILAAPGITSVTPDQGPSTGGRVKVVLAGVTLHGAYP